MLFANEYEIREWAIRYGSQPILGCAARTLESLMEAVNACSDGWPYWSAPVTSASKLITLLNDADRALRRGVTPAPTEDDLRLAYRPIRSFHTRYGERYGFDVKLHLPVAVSPAPAHEPLTLFA